MGSCQRTEVSLTTSTSSRSRTPRATRQPILSSSLLGSRTTTRLQGLEIPNSSSLPVCPPCPVASLASCPLSWLSCRPIHSSFCSSTCRLQVFSCSSYHTDLQ